MRKTYLRNGMQLPTLKEFTEAMSANWRSALAAGFASSLTTAGSIYRWPLLKDLPSWVALIFFIVAIFSWSIVLANLVGKVASSIQLAIKRSKYRSARKKVVEKLHRLPEEQHRVMAHHFEQNKQSFTAKFNQPELEPLLALGLVEIVPGTHNRLRWPYIIPDDVWAEMDDHRDNFTIK
ncbi:MAG: super-infection exclusion protein B [Roseovarius sp.]|nr:super-infection exclusion protein B [Roseovarius sp.]